MNPFYKPEQGSGGFGMPSPFQNFTNMLSQFNSFRANFQGNPQQKVQELLNNGQMSQEQFRQLSNMAQQFRQFIGG